MKTLKQIEHKFANEKSKSIFGIDEFNWLNSDERLHLRIKYNLVCLSIDNTYTI